MCGSGWKSTFRGRNPSAFISSWTPPAILRFWPWWQPWDSQPGPLWCWVACLHSRSQSLMMVEVKYKETEWAWGRCSAHFHDFFFSIYSLTHLSVNTWLGSWQDQKLNPDAAVFGGQGPLPRWDLDGKASFSNLEILIAHTVSENSLRVVHRYSENKVLWSIHSLPKSHPFLSWNIIWVPISLRNMPFFLIEI